MPSNSESRTTRRPGSSLLRLLCALSAAPRMCPRPAPRASGSIRACPSRTRQAPSATQFSKASRAKSRGGPRTAAPSSTSAAGTLGPSRRSARA
eukprot:5786727-Lingulodinium_polyedra.AAC.1